MVNNLEKPLTALFSRVLFCIRLCPLYTRVCEDIGRAAALPMGVAPEASANRLRLGEGYVVVLLQPCPGWDAFRVILMRLLLLILVCFSVFEQGKDLLRVFGCQKCPLRKRVFKRRGLAFTW